LFFELDGFMAAQVADLCPCLLHKDRFSAMIKFKVSRARIIHEMPSFGLVVAFASQKLALFIV
jgi:hypothetical protein